RGQAGRVDQPVGAVLRPDVVTEVEVHLAARAAAEREVTQLGGEVLGGRLRIRRSAARRGHGRGKPQPGKSNRSHVVPPGSLVSQRGGAAGRAAPAHYGQSSTSASSSRPSQSLSKPSAHRPTSLALSGSSCGALSLQSRPPQAMEAWPSPSSSSSPPPPHSPGTPPPPQVVLTVQASPSSQAPVLSG